MFLKAELDEAVDGIHQCLVRTAHELKCTRKGSSWDFWVAGRPYSALAQATEKLLNEVQDDLLDFGLLPEDAPTTLLLSAGLNGDEDYDVLGRISADLIARMAGAATEPVK